MTKPYFEDAFTVLYQGNCLDVLPQMAADSVQCVVTSPPYWGLRKYAGAQDVTWADGSRCAYGLEPTIQMYVDHTVEVLRAIRRVLMKDGVVFWNIGDSYNGTKVGNTETNKYLGVVTTKPLQSNGLKPKDLCLIPSRVALAAQADGWWVRSDIIWNKPNPMPESVTDRPTDAYEHILMFTKSARYYWDQEGVRETADTLLDCKASPTFGAKNGKAEQIYGAKHLVSGEKWVNTGRRNIRNVWTFPTQPYPEAHFATFPEALPERCIKAATSEKGCCPDCGKPWERIIEKGLTAHTEATESLYEKGTNANRLSLLRQQARVNGGEYVNESKTIGWRPSCDCGGDPVPCVVLDPFAGSGTTLWVAKTLGRKGSGIELSDKYCGLIVDRCGQSALL